MCSSAKTAPQKKTHSNKKTQLPWKNKKTPTQNKTKQKKQITKHKNKTFNRETQTNPQANSVTVLGPKWSETKVWLIFYHTT